MLLDSIRTWGGGEKWCVETAAALCARGHRVAIAGALGSALLERARETDLETFVLASFPLGALSLARTLARERFELVVANVGRDVRLGAVACTLSGARLLQRRGIARPLKRDPLSRFLYAKCVRRVVANCEAIRTSLLTNAGFVDPARFVVIRNAVALPASDESMDLRAELGLAPGALLVGSAGRLSPMKGLEHLIDAFARVRKVHPTAHLVLAGDGELADELARRAHDLGLDATVHLLGFRDDAPAIVGELDVFVLASVRDEGESHALLEAMARSRPSVVTRCGGLPETVGDGVGGLVVPPAEPDALAQAIARLLSNPDERQSLGRSARDGARESHAPDVVTARWEELLTEVAAEG